GHVGWFQTHWLVRNPQRHRGCQADPAAVAVAADDALYDSSRVPHAERWRLPVPGPAALRRQLAEQLERSLALLAALPDDADDDALYFFRLALLHEDMHHEAALYMARAVGVPIADPRWQARALPASAPPLRLPAGRWRLGSDAQAGFAFDNELAAHEVVLPALEIDASARAWADYLPFIEDGGYQVMRWWDEPGQAWLRASGARAPRYLRREGGGWEHWLHGRWQALDPRQPACHLSAHEARAWCRWAGRQLPTEAQWERAALTGGSAFRWGDVWEWTASPFAPFAGFRAHPYRDYSAPFFDGRPVLRGGSCLTQPRLRHPRYRNYFPPDRSDVPAGFRSCAL
ncbi:MAG: SUMF1/EgtB/PvdO family nonheme iron enzyme, partial [Betaproteobacteria bacterium]|nr:SUMF1/EgtB/PvdO family nonheme iron enzyme [Betaproteobacteria bacterium]